MVKRISCFLLFAFSAACQPLNAQKIESIRAKELVGKFKDADGVLVINFWSTWCKPCIEEIPGFIEVFESLKSKGVHLWLVSQDTRELYKDGKLKNYISLQKGWDKATLFWFNETNADYYCPLIDSSWSGVIPATLILNKKNGYRKFIEESLSIAGLKREIELAWGKQ